MSDDELLPYWNRRYDVENIEWIKTTENIDDEEVPVRLLIRRNRFVARPRRNPDDIAFMKNRRFEETPWSEEWLDVIFDSK